MMNYLNTYRRYACDINRINEEAKNNARALVTMTEELYRNDLKWIAGQILGNEGHRHVVMLSGPSSSGKTTTSKKLCDEFISHGVDVQLISMDDFYLGVDYVGRLPNGKPDFESVDSLDIPLIRKSIHELSTTGECVIPIYDFEHSRRSDKTRTIKLGKESVIIMEGIHALNPIFSKGSSKAEVVKVYTAVKQGIKNNEDYVLTNREIRFIRRIVRDYHFRKVDPVYMLSMWGSVIEGEKKYIRPYRYTSDFTINSIHIYEPCVLKTIALPVLEAIPASNPHYDFVCRIKEALCRFETIDNSIVPENSLLREFIGGGCYSY